MKHSELRGRPLPLHSVPKELRDLARLALQHDWHLSATGSNHIKWVSPAGRVVITGMTPARRKHTLCTRALLKRAGLPLSD